MSDCGEQNSIELWTAWPIKSIETIQEPGQVAPESSGEFPAGGQNEPFSARPRSQAGKAGYTKKWRRRFLVLFDPKVACW